MIGAMKRALGERRSNKQVKKNLDTDDDWRLDVVCGVYNQFAAAGRFSREETKLLVDMSKSMVRPKELSVTLKQRSELKVTTMKIIYDARYKHIVHERGGRSQMQ